MSQDHSAEQADQESTETPAEDMRAKFREALAKKNARNQGGRANLDGKSAVRGSSSGPVQQREFRRKSGG
ncbi:DUF5302 domain-containing protein [Leucobacter luti]|uniref:DUF5302 domain-containing protein n=1 Tax=Leucobacter luti TaxID=340320 RepID=A0A4V3CY23_9MICO|nr:DUF5302 domain-containing protein [Leucobacter luti]MCW2287782.1 hypothetical protein [Leucobacter luti]QYM76211.1 DUF5302 domain-containing protein [Leucobacter luti]TCK46055.1 hypothetical protein EDF60_1301 [Leucobacter luti]TDP92478.1 hypothetical protein EDF62_1692 [Leucobacter luti]